MNKYFYDGNGHNSRGLFDGRRKCACCDAGWRIFLPISQSKMSIFLKAYSKESKVNVVVPLSLLLLSP
jgi:hypothetical protein